MREYDLLSLKRNISFYCVRFPVQQCKSHPYDKRNETHMCSVKSRITPFVGDVCYHNVMCFIRSKHYTRLDTMKTKAKCERVCVVFVIFVECSWHHVWFLRVYLMFCGACTYRERFKRLLCAFFQCACLKCHISSRAAAAGSWCRSLYSDSLIFSKIFRSMELLLHFFFIWPRNEIIVDNKSHKVNPSQQCQSSSKRHLHPRSVVMMCVLLLF